MISAWDIYWVMQLDSIGGAVFVLALSAFIAAVVLLIMGGCNAHEVPEEWGSDVYRIKAQRALARAPALIGAGKRLAFLAAFLAIAVALTPSTKTAAMMLVIPAVANNEAIQREAGDLYGIAKDALRELAKPKHEQPDK